MKDVNRLLERARAILGSLDFGLFPDNDDGFLDALGVDKTKYEVKHPDGTIGYDFLAALSDLAVEDWSGFEEPCRADVKQVPDEVKPEEIPKKSRKVQNLFGWG